jgi:hypothetical protein
MSSEKGLTINGVPRKRRLKGFDPLINARAPTSLIEMVKAKANERNVAFSVIVREALNQYVENGEGTPNARSIEGRRVSALGGDVIFPAIAGQSGLLVWLDARTSRAE